jgi:hypothetical protein
MNLLKKSILLPMLLIVLTTYAQDDGHNEHATDDKHNESTHHRNHIAIYDGAITNFKHDVTSYTLGLDYEYNMEHIGVGIFGELIFAEETEILTGLLASYKMGNLKLLTGPFVEFAKSHDAHATSHDEKYHHKFGARVGLAYNFHVKKITISPGISTDYIEGGIWALTYGVGLGFGF